MTINAGIWIDHHKAVVVHVTDEKEEIRSIMADDSSERTAGGARLKNSHSANDFVAEKTRDRKAMNHLNKFYDEVIDCLADADAILVLGPGEAKGEFVKRIESKSLKGRITHVGTVDKMTDREIAAHVRQLLGVSSPRRQGQPMQE